MYQKKANTFYMFHDELFYELIHPKIKKDNGTKIEVVSDNKTFSTHALFLLIILLDYYKKNGEVPISLKYIHKCYRNKRVGKALMTGDIDFETYKNALMELQEKIISVAVKKTRKKYGVGNLRIEGKRLLTIKDFKQEKNGDTSINYTFGQYGEILLKSKRYSDLIPIDVIHLSYQQVEELYIAMYISRLIFINKRKKISTFTIMLSSLMNNIKIHNKNGFDTGILLKEILNENTINKYNYLKIFKKHIVQVLKMFIDNFSIISYEFFPASVTNINIKNYEMYKLQIIIK